MLTFCKIISQAWQWAGHKFYTVDESYFVFMAFPFSCFSIGTEKVMYFSVFMLIHPSCPSNFSASCLIIKSWFDPLSKTTGICSQSCDCLHNSSDHKLFQKLFWYHEIPYHPIPPHHQETFSHQIPHHCHHHHCYNHCDFHCYNHCCHKHHKTIFCRCGRISDYWMIQSPHLSMATFLFLIVACFCCVLSYICTELFDAFNTSLKVAFSSTNIEWTVCR